MVLKSTKRSGLNTLASLGVASTTPPNIFTNDRAPATTDNRTKDFFIGDLWLDRSTLPVDIWILVDLADNIATWVKFGISTESTSTYITNNGVAESLLGYLNVFGDSLINTSASGNTININLTNGLAGQVLIGSGTDSPEWAYITSTSGSLDITYLDNAIEIETTGIAALSQFTAGDSNVAIPDGVGTVTFAGSTNIATTGNSLSTLSIALKDDVVIANSLTLSSQTSGVLQTSATGVVFSSKGTNGQVLIGGGTEPNWANITSSDGSMLISNGPNTINIETKPGYPSRPVEFFAYQDGDVLSILGGTETYKLGTSLILTERFNVGGGLDPGNGVGQSAIFTAPIDGKYFLYCSFLMAIYSTTAIIPYYVDPDVRIITTNKSYACISNEDFDSTVFYDKYKKVSAVVDMTAGDTAVFQAQCNIGNPGTINVLGNFLYYMPGAYSLRNIDSYIFGYYVG